MIMIILVLLSRGVTAIIFQSPLSARVLTPSCLDSLALGGLLAVLLNDPRSAAVWRRWSGPVTALALLAFAAILTGRRLTGKGLRAGIDVRKTWPLGRLRG